MHLFVIAKLLFQVLTSGVKHHQYMYINSKTWVLEQYLHKQSVVNNKKKVDISQFYSRVCKHPLRR